MRLSVLFSLASGAVLQVAKGSYYQHELRLFHSLRNYLHPKDILVYDRAGGHFVLAAQFIQINVDLISRVFKHASTGARANAWAPTTGWWYGKRAPKNPPI